jgi:hypothetical protein
MVASQETPLELAQRRVRDAEALVERQMERIAELAREKRDTSQAQAILATFETTLRFMRQDLDDCLKAMGRPPQ